MRILHVYGPSETTITATQWEVGAVGRNRASGDRATVVERAGLRGGPG